MAAQTPMPQSRNRATEPPLKECGGPCGRCLPHSSFGVRAKSSDGLFPICKVCRRKVRGPRGKEGQQARSLEKELWVLRELYDSAPSLADVLSRAIGEVQQIGVTGVKLDEQVRAVRQAVLVHGCRRVDEVVEETRLSRWAVDRALEILLAEKVLETRNSYRHAEEAEGPGRPVTEYHPKDSPRGEDFTYILDRSRDDDLL